MRTRFQLIGLTLCLASSGGGRSFGQAATQSAQLVPGMPAPELRVAKWLKGTPVAAFEPGKVYVLEYWATWCAPCKRQMPHLSELARKYAGRATFIGVDVMERAQDGPTPAEAFVAKMGDQMDYSVACDGPERFMQANWLRAARAPGIPSTFVVFGAGKIAWIGYPTRIDAVLQQVLAGTWDTQAAARDYRLGAVDMAVIPKMNAFLTARDYAGALAEVDRMVAAEPGLRYRPYVGHYRFCALAHLAPDRAVEFGRAWVAANDDTPPLGDIVGMLTMKSEKYARELYLFGAECLDQSVARYGDASSKPTLYDQQADCYLSAGETALALRSEGLAVTSGKEAGLSPEKIRVYEQKQNAIQLSMTRSPK